MIYNFPFTSEDLRIFPPDAQPPLVPETECFDLSRDPGEKHPVREEKQLAGYRSRILALKKLILQAEKKKTGPASKGVDEARKILKSLGYI